MSESPEPKGVKPIDTVTVVVEFKSDKENLLNLLVGDTVHVLNKTDSGWWDGVVVFNSETTRGWFPGSHTKSIVATTTTEADNNNRPQNLSSLLRQNLTDNYKPRKNSSVSFASSEHSYRSDSTNTQHQHHQQQQLSKSVSVDPESPVIDLGTIKTVTPLEAEAIFSSAGSSNVPIWTPLSTTEGTIVYFNSELDIYCKELPYIENPEIDENTNIAIPVKKPLNNQAPAAVDLSLSQSSQSHRSSVKTRQSTLNFERKDSAKASSVRSRSSLPSNTTTIHPWNTSLYSEPHLFYSDPTDIKTWSGLRDAFIYFLSLTLDSLQKKIGVLFHTYFNIASRLGVLINLSARLAQHDLQKSGYQNRVQRRLKRISSSIAQVGINGNLYLTEPSGERGSSTTSQVTLRPTDSTESTPNLEPNTNFLHQVETEIDNLKKNSIQCIKVFMQISSNQLNDQNFLPQVYPRFLTGFFSGGNWRNPFVPEPKDPFAGKEVAKSLHHKKPAKAILNRETFENLDTKKEQLKLTLEEVLILLREKPNEQSRNVEILSKINRSLNISTKFIDTVEGLDFSIFLTTRRNSIAENEFDPSKLIYPVLTELFETKQDLRDVVVSIIMGCQNLTLNDPTVFKSIREDQLDAGNKFANIEPEKTAKYLEVELQKVDIEKDSGISIDVDNDLAESILKCFNILDISVALVSQLIGERDALLNYATRVMNDDFQNFEFFGGREDSAITTDEIALPASTTNRNNINKDVPWYLDAEEYNLIFTNNDTIKGGTREALIQRLTHHDLLDASFNLTFLTTFRSMLKTSTLIELLIKRFNIEPPENLSYEEYTDWVSKKNYPIKLRVVNIMKSLLQKYWISNYNEPKLIKIWGPFIDELLEQKFPGSEALSREYKKKVVDPDSNKSKQQASSTLHELSPKARKLKVTDLDTTEFANQLTIRESALYSQITQVECLDKTWNKKYGSLGGYANLQKFISNSNDLTNFVSTQIITQTDAKKRLVIIRYFVAVAEVCKNLNNYSSMTAIISALYSSPIHRLKKTWKLVPQNVMNSVSKMNDLMNSSRNFSEYREVLRSINDKPCVPFLGVFLSDLTFTTNGNPDHLHGDHKLVNFAKRTKTVEILRDISKYQSLNYNLKKNDDVQDFITFRLANVLNIDDQYNRSLAIEPRIKVSQQIQNSNGNNAKSTYANLTSKYQKQPKYLPSFPDILSS